MFILGLQGSPRKNGNTNFLLSAFIDETKKYGAQTKIVQVSKKKILPCIGCGSCEKTGICVIKDEMGSEIIPLFRKADVIVLASPIFFYSTTAQMKIIIDRSQSLWSRKYRLQLADPGSKIRRGFLLSLGATKGDNLFYGVSLTAKYFFDAVDAVDEGSLTYRHIENKGDMEKHPTVIKDICSKVEKFIKPLSEKKTVLFACVENACRSQMAAGFAQKIAKDKINILCGGSKPSEKINQTMIDVMREKGIDMAYRIPGSIDQAVNEAVPSLTVTMGCGEKCPNIQGTKYLDWDLPDPAGKSVDFMRNVRDEIEKRVTKLISRSFENSFLQDRQT